MSGILLVPVHLDALWLRNDLSVVDPKADFTRLPFWDGDLEINPDVANISEGIVSQPFGDKGFQLKAGVHLHWALPDALTRGSAGKAKQRERRGATFPAVPNRWLISSGAKGSKTPHQQWIVESDYIHPHATERVHHAVAVPFPFSTGEAPFRHLGRRKPFAGWLDNAECLASAGYRLTAIGYEPNSTGDLGKHGGYGEPTFAALYPNCHSVFGFHDRMPPDSLKGAYYEVLGWYSDPEKLDCLRTEHFAQALAAARNAKGHASEGEMMSTALRDAFRWRAAVASDLPDRIVCYARLEFDAANPDDPRLHKRAVEVAVGNTSTEALSAYLADGDRELEEQLESLHLAPRLHGRKLDIGFKFRELRHEKGFAPVAGGLVWAIRPQETSADARKGPDARMEQPLPSQWAHLLNELNLRQVEYDRAAEDLTSMRRQLFADWYMYMLCTHPPDDHHADYPAVDELRHFIDKNDLQPLERQQKRVLALERQRTRAHRSLHDAIAAPPASVTAQHVLQSVPAPRYWHPHDPAILIVDECVEATTRHGQDGRLDPEGLLCCHVVTSSDGPVYGADNIERIRHAIDGLEPTDNQEAIGFSKWSKQPWNPFALEWRVELFPVREQNGLDTADGEYSSSFIDNNYELAVGNVDLTPKAGKATTRKAMSVYSGSSLLTPHAKRQLENRIQAFLEERKADGDNDDHVVKAIHRVRDRLAGGSFHALAQRLHGCGEALLMHKQTMQLPIAEPFGFADAQAFSDRVRAAVQYQNRSAPQPGDDFQPIRAGSFRIHLLRLVDTFGRTQSLRVKNDKVIVSEALHTHGAPDRVSLSPRLVQPARLNFRWLAADRGGPNQSDEIEMTAHPNTTPICGWLLPNDLDDSLMIYDAGGAPLGSLRASLDAAKSECEWIPAPGGSSMSIEHIANGHLKRLVGYLKKQDAASFERFLANVQSAFERIDPESHAQHDALALLVGRPMALVRTTLDLQLRGRPAISQSWNNLRRDMDRDLRGEAQGMAATTTRHSHSATRVQFPIRLGAARQLNDGLVCFWKEASNGGAPEYDYEGGPRWPAFDAGSEPDLLQSIGDPPQKLTMLMDPLGVVHASSGVLPMKSIHIPAAQYANALQKMAMTFLCAPILTTQGRVEVPLPGEPGYAWSWLVPDAAARDISPVSLDADLDATSQIVEGWLQLSRIEK